MEVVLLLSQYMTEYGSTIFYTIVGIFVEMISSKTKINLKKYIEIKTKKTIDMTIVKVIEEICLNNISNSKDKALKILHIIVDKSVLQLQKKLVLLIENILKVLKHNHVD